MCGLWGYDKDDSHIIYQNLRHASDERKRLIHQRVDLLWQKFEPFADKEFADEFARSPDQRYWEMYIGCRILEKGFNLSQKKAGPDLSFEVDGKRIWIEAVTPTMGEGGRPDSVPDLLSLLENEVSEAVPVAQAVPRDKIILRLTSALKEKEDKFKNYVKKGMVEKSDIKVIAVSSAAIRGWSKGDPPYILSALFSLGPLRAMFDRKTFEVITQEYDYQPKIAKHNGVPVETLFFVDPSHSDISAVIHSNADICNSPPQIDDDLLVIHNPYAQNPLPRGLLPCAREYWAQENGDFWELRFEDII